MNAARARRLGAWLAAASLGCSPEVKLLTVPLEQQPADAQPIVVPFPPPPARAEVIGDPPAEGAAWVDGQWLWRGRRWVWSPGCWAVDLAPDLVYSPPYVVRRSDGALLWYEGVLRPGAGAPFPPRSEPSSSPGRAKCSEPTQP